MMSPIRDLIVMLTKEHQIILLFNIIKIFHKFKIFEYHQIQNFINNMDLRKQVFLSVEKISELSGPVNKDFMQSWFNNTISLAIVIIKIFRRYLNRYYLMIFSWLYYKLSPNRGGGFVILWHKDKRHRA